MKITKKSQLTGKQHTMDLDVTPEQITTYNEGVELIQNIFPDLDADEREFLMTGITNTEWNSAFGTDED